MVYMNQQDLEQLFIVDKLAAMPLIDKLITKNRFLDLNKLTDFYLSNYKNIQIPSTHLNGITLSLLKMVCIILGKSSDMSNKDVLNTNKLN